MRLATRSIFLVCCVAAALVISIHAARSAPFAGKPAAAGARCDHQHPLNCRRAVAYWRMRALDAQAAVSWQRHARATDVRRVLESVRGTQPYTYAAKLAYLACTSFSATPTRCTTPGAMLGVARCESGLQSHDPNPRSTADGWLQFLTSTWNRTHAGQQGFSRYDVLAMGIAGAELVHSDGSWREWSCGWAS